MSLADAPTLAAALRAARERLGQTHQDLAETTRVRRDYLIALEQGAWDRLPSRPFAIGYVRAYAQALGLDEETAADRFKAECPDQSSPLAAPVGSELDDVKPRSAPWVFAIALIVVGVVGWNVAQHVMSTHKVNPTDLASAASKADETWKLGGGLNRVQLGVPGAPPEGQGLPAPYITPGLEDKLGQAQQDQATLQRASLNGPAIPTGAAFNPQGPIYGAEPGASAVTLQARKPAAVVLRSPDGVNVIFAKQLAAGEAYRAPQSAGSPVIDVSDPNAFAVYLNGEYRGPLKAAITPLAQLNAEAAQLAAQAAAQAQRVAPLNPDEAGPTPTGDSQNPGV